MPRICVPVFGSGVVLVNTSAAPLYYTGTVRNTDGSQSDTQAKINAASSRDVVRLPASGSFTWSSTVSIPNSKGILLDGNGSTITRGMAGTSSLITLSAHTSISSRIANLTTVHNGTTGNVGMYVDATGSDGRAPFRIDHCTFGQLDREIAVGVSGGVPGLMDRCTLLFGSPTGGGEVVHNTAYGPTPHTSAHPGWTNVVTPGSADAFYMEDCTFTAVLTDIYFFAASAIQSYYGARSVVRFCTLNDCQLDQHGGIGDDVGARWWELYWNSLVLHQYLGTDPSQSDYIHLRDGSGFVFLNAKTGAHNNGAGSLRLENETTGGYPQLFQIGRGINQTLVPCYEFSNTANGDGTMVAGLDDVNSPGLTADQDTYFENASFTGASGVGIGPIGSRPATCTAGVGYWATDEGNWRAGYPNSSGRFYKATGTNVWSLHYEPYAYPHPLTTGLNGPFD